MFDKYITFLTFIPWLIIFIIYTINNINKISKENHLLKYLKNHFFQIFRLDLLFLILVFYYFASFNKDFVDKYLFVVMSVYLCVNSFYESKSNLKKNFFQNNLVIFLCLIPIILVPFIVYFTSSRLVLTYKIMLCYLFFNSLIILGLSYLQKIIKK